MHQSPGIRSSPLLILVAVIGLLACGAPTAAQPATPGVATPLKVGVYLNNPFVRREGDHYTGFAIDLWQAVADKAGLKFQYQRYPTVPALLDAVQSHAIDVAVTNLTITADRLQRMDFTLPFMNTGLRLMINEDRRGGFWQVVDNLRAGGHLKIYALILAGVILGTVGLTLLDRRFDEDFPSEWSKGVSDSFYHVMSLVTSGTSSHKPLFGVTGRVLAALWMACGVALIAYITSSITSVMTTTNLTSQISSTADLNRKRVGAIAGGVGAEYARNAGYNLETFPHLEDAVRALVKGQIDAIVGDAPPLEAYDNEHPELPITEVGAVFRPEQYGFAVPSGSPLGHVLSIQILSLMESDYTEKLRSKYFGNTP